MTDHIEPKLPALLAEIAELVGEDAAIAIARAKGGGKTDFPTKADDDHWLVKLIGRERADVLMAHFATNGAGIRLHVPLGPTRLPNHVYDREPCLRRLPDLLVEIAEVVGIDAALAIAEIKGGARTDLPAKAGDNHWLVRLIGRARADKLMDHFRVNGGGVRLHIPLGPTRLYDKARFRAVELRKTLSIAETARRVGVSTRAVEKWCAEERAREAAEGKPKPIEPVALPPPKKPMFKVRPQTCLDKPRRSEER